MLFGLRPLPYAHAEGSMFMDSRGGQDYRQPASWPAFVEQATRDMIPSRVTWMLAAGAMVGLILTVVVRKLVGTVIYFNAQNEAGSFHVPVLLLVMAGWFAAQIPATCAASIEPMQAL